ncbi:hypothetical protein GJ496_000706 [Pomphorhynchus laevis]|nr:hypothetical protein GJ496_000706 [Pomphorhynchus laevis]
MDGNLYAIRFNGPPREIFIDSIAHVIPFDRPGRVKFVRKAHEIAWGGPGFEIIVDGKPYELSFNNPGRDILFGQHLHHVRIQGSLPELKIMGSLPFDELPSNGNIPVQASVSTPDDIHDINSIAGLNSPALCSPLTCLTENTNHMPLLPNPYLQHQSAGEHVRPQIHLSQLYNKLIHHGIINSSKPVVNNPRQFEFKPLTSDQNTIQRFHSESSTVSKEDHLDAVLNQSMKELNVEDMKHFDKSVIDAFYVGTQCPQCGLRFGNELKSQYQTHLDWHFRWNRKEKDVILGGRTMHREWYYSLDVWLKIEEIRDDNDIVLPEDESLDKSAPKREFYSCPAALDDCENICRVCFESFDQFYNDEREEWHLKEAVRVGDWVYHATCLQDAVDLDKDCFNTSLVVTEVVEGMLAILANQQPK